MRSSRPTKALEAVEGEEVAEEDVVEEGRLVAVWPEDAPGLAVVAPQPREVRGLAPGAGLEAVVVGAEAAAGRVVVELKSGPGRGLQ